jgi:Mrr restriction endonuclease-like protein
MSLPGPVEMRQPALEWAMTRRGGYLSAELKEYLAEYFKLTEEQVANFSPEGRPVFGNNVDWVTSHFTEFGMHTGLDGRDHDSPDDRYYLTKYGYAVGERKVLWPTKRRHGPRNASPDPRQLLPG